MGKNIEPEPDLYRFNQFWVMSRVWTIASSHIHIFGEHKKKFVDPFNSDEGFIAAVEDDLDYEFEKGVDYIKDKYSDTY